MRKVIIVLSMVMVFSKLTCPTRAQSSNYHTNIERTRQLIDRIIDTVLTKIKEDFVRPIALESVATKWKKENSMVPGDGEVVLENGKVWGIDTVKRNSEALFTFLDDSRIDVNFTAVFHQLNFSYDFEAKSNKMQTSGTIRGELTRLISDIGMVIDIKNRIIKVMYLRLVSAKSVIMYVDKQHYTDKLRNYVLKLVSNMKTTITSTIESELQRLLEDTIPYDEYST